MRKHSSQQGFSIIELMVGIAVLGVLLGVGVPTFIEITNSNRITTQTNELVSALNYARSEAVKRGDPVSVCSSTNGATCSASNNWSNGWIVFTDATGAVGTLDAADALLQTWPATGGLSLTTSGPSIRYRASGMVATARNFTLIKTGCSGPKARQVSVALVGRVSSAKIDCP